MGSCVAHPHATQLCRWVSARIGVANCGQAQTRGRSGQLVVCVEVLTCDQLKVAERIEGRTTSAVIWCNSGHTQQLRSEPFDGACNDPTSCSEAHVSG